MRICAYSMICACAVAVWLFSDVEAKSVQEKGVNDPFMSAPSGVMPNCEREQRFKYDVNIGSVDDFIALLKSHQSDQQLHGFQPTEASLVPGYTLQSVGNDEKKRIKLDDLKGKVQSFEVKNSKLQNKRIFILQISHDDYNEGWPWQLLITASDQGHVSVLFCAGI